MNIADYKGVWVFAEQREGELQKVSLELLGEGRRIADELGVNLTALLLGSNIEGLAKTLAEHGADEVLVADDKNLEHYTTDAYTKVICDLANERKPGILFVGATFIGRDLGPRIAARLSTGLTADCTSIDVDVTNGDLLATRPAFGGNLMATIACPEHRPQMATVRPGVFAKITTDPSKCKIEKVDVKLADSDVRTKVLETIKAKKDIVDIAEADFIVSGGRGVGNKENFQLLKELAEALGGTVAGSRAAVEKGWIDGAYQVGQTGKTVRPQIYIACGISGAIQHVAGMQDSDLIIAVNKDDSAPIMKIADYAIVGDLTKVVPELIAQVKEIKSAE
ncbi:electron transfer flavoprotein subunit alpha/FixB family protein [Clostridium beijerinckii]|jgi:electron transfer flavoprotein alpha subunit|uniref:Electron transfer flavoprotein alpha subunit n=10 Tax=Clostridiaceae TaxID=31979 RepID=Q8RMI4_CLOBE|nr:MULTISPECIES: electron transfer flavoprotein subunit alpha/FixB family protein [Clostridium]AAM14585.1 electron-transferring flavoprotein alpha-subunit [Clostridium beijerinckii]ALB48325.1 electron transfer flavoprotein subunit alpha/FixB family protein [Clostridium beijerinckii NRRL B-598]AVK49407.1 electron transfer flavoprotein subunit alpha [Clostridium sp. MF28]AVK50986.1 electron transfer flavoprotein subunit alpha [Clostridium sp. MF28]MBA8933921.1 electron transfer flavoprotein alph